MITMALAGKDVRKFDHQINNDERLNAVSIWLLWFTRRLIYFFRGEIFQTIRRGCLLNVNKVAVSGKVHSSRLPIPVACGNPVRNVFCWFGRIRSFYYLSVGVQSIYDFHLLLVSCYRLNLLTSILEE